MRAVVATSESKCYVFQDVDTEEPFGPFAEFVRQALSTLGCCLCHLALLINVRAWR